eukprot:COSAG01_NODE_9706_length_2365_cov_4.086055_2_plen_112_part_00
MAARARAPAIWPIRVHVSRRVRAQLKNEAGTAMNRVTAICRTSGIHVQTFAFKRKRRNLPFAFNVQPILGGGCATGGPEPDCAPPAFGHLLKFELLCVFAAQVLWHYVGQD